MMTTMMRNKRLHLHAALKLSHILVTFGFAEDKQVLVVDEQEITLGLTLPSLASAFHLPLHLDDIFPQDEANL